MEPTHLLLLLLPLLVAPFVQEDVAVFAAATMAATMMHRADPLLVGVVALTGMVASDVWKFWAGRLAQRHDGFRRWAEKPGVVSARDKVLGRLGVTLFVVRFVPGTRIGAYVAAGFFGAPFRPFLLYVAASAALYLVTAFGLVMTLGAVAGKDAVKWLPLVVVTAVAVPLMMRTLAGMARRRARA